MGLAAPAGLLLAALAAPLILLYFLKLRRRAVPVSSSLLWRRVLEDRRANAPWERLRRNLLLLLQLLVLALLALASAGPYVTGETQLAGESVVVLDVSASMGARVDGSTTRLDLARKKVASLVDAMEGGRRVALVVAGPAPDVAAPLTTDGATLRRGLDAARATEAPADMSAALELAHGLVRGRKDAEVVLVTDGAFDADGAVKDALTACRVVRVAEEGPADNAGITAVSLRPQPGRLEAAEMLVELTWKGAADVAASLSVESAPVDLEASPTAWKWAAVDSADVVLSAQQPLARVMAVTAPEGSALRLKLTHDGDDALAADDEALVVMPRRAALRVLVVSASPYILTRALGAVPGVEVFEAAALPADASTYDLVVIDGASPTVPPATPVLSFGAPPGGAAVLEGPRIVSWDRRHPALRHLELDAVQVGRAWQWKPQPTARVLIEGDVGPLALTWTAPGGRILAFTFDLTESDLPLRVAFPILVADAVDWLTQRGADLGVLATGRSTDLPLEAAEAQVDLVEPGGARRTLEVRGGQLRLPALTRVGLHRIELANAPPRALAAALLSVEETDLSPRGLEETTPASAANADAAVLRVPGRHHLWPWLAMAALGVLFVEWSVFHRRRA